MDFSDEMDISLYDHANRLVGVTQGSDVYSFVYLGSGDRVGQTVNGVMTTYALDLNAGLTQVLSDGANTYLYGNGRIAQMNGVDSTYFLGDALGSVRQLTDASGAVTLTKGYEPYGGVLYSQGSGASSYGYTGEWLDETGLTFLRSRYYSGVTGRFISQDTWSGDNKAPLSYNLWLYAYANPIRFADSGGNRPAECFPMDWCDRGVGEDSPNIIGYSEKIPPRNITWLTNKYANLVHYRLAPLFDQNDKLIVRTNAAQFRIKNHPGYNHCGDVVLSAVIRLYDPQITAEWVVENLTDRDPVDGTTTHKNLADFVNKNFSEYLYASYENDIDESSLVGNVQQWIKSKKLIIPLVTIISGSSWVEYGGKVGSGTIPHWVLITGISNEWKNQSDSSWNWIRIFNPFDNESEYYWWKDFRQAWQMGSKRGTGYSTVLLQSHPKMR